MKVGVLGLQGDVREHVRALEAVGATPVVVKQGDELRSVDGLVLPGGESTTIAKLLERFEMRAPLSERIEEGMPVYGTCAGLILLAKDVIGREQLPFTFGALDATVRRNAYGRQVDSFEADLDLEGEDERFPAVFIRAPLVEDVGDDVRVLACWEERPVLVQQGRVLASTFHPEMTDDARVHRIFVSMVGH